jgi:DNA-binding LacI/PurR family transcriptional regulator
VLAAIKELNYTPNAAARTLARGKTGMVGLILPSLFDAFMTDVMSSAEKALKEKGYFMAVTTASSAPDLEELGAANHFIGDRVDGLLIMSPLPDNSFILELKKKSIPLVLLDQHQLNLQLPTVTVDNFYGGYEATKCLIHSGAKKIAHISGSSIFESSRERTAGFLEALRYHGMQVDEEHLVNGDFTVMCGYKTTRMWLDRGILPDAVFASDDNIAFGVLDAAREAGIPVPQRLSVIGYDNHPFTALFHPSVSTVKQPAEEMGRYGVDLLLDIIGHKARRTGRTVLKPAILLRDTTR